MEYTSDYYMIALCHLFVRCIVVFGWLVNNKIILRFFLLVDIYVLIMYLLWDGCVLSKVEKTYTKDKPSDFDKHTAFTSKYMIGEKYVITILFLVFNILVIIYKLTRKSK